MADLNVEKSGFDGCITRMEALASGLQIGGVCAQPSTSGDTSLTGEQEQACYEALLTMIEDLISLANETAEDMKLTKARYLLADK